MDTVGIVVLVGTLVLASAAGLVLRARDGRIRTPRRIPNGAGGWAFAGPSPAATDRVLLLQLSSPVCAPCRQTAAVLADLTARTPGVVHVEVDVADRPDVARELGIMRTPTVVAFDRGGAELLRVSGVPHPADLAAALAVQLGPV